MRAGLVVAAILIPFWVQSVQGNEPDWTSRVIKRGADRQQSNATDILARPNRPLHVYGNTVRRAHYRGQLRPSLSDIRHTLNPSAER